MEYILGVSKSYKKGVTAVRLENVMLRNLPF